MIGWKIIFKCQKEKSVDKKEVKLLEDIFSYGKNKIQYGKKNQVVKIISIHGEVLIVQGKERFPVHKSKTNFE